MVPKAFTYYSLSALSAGDVMSLLHAGKMLQAMGYAGPLLIYSLLSSVLGVPWLQSMYGGAVMLPKSGSELDDEVDFSMATTCEAILERPDGVAMELLRRICSPVKFPMI